MEYCNGFYRDEEVTLCVLKKLLEEDVYEQIEDKRVEYLEDEACEALSGRGLVKKVKAGRERAVVKDARDRRAIRAAVKCLLKMGLSQTEACRQVSDQVTKGRAGEHMLTMKYDAVGFEASPMIVRRVARARW